MPARLLRVAADDRLVELVRNGSEPAFEAIFDRHHRGILTFCRHMLGSADEAEDAVQHTFMAAYRDLLRSSKALQLRPWLYAIARNRCLDLLRARREKPLDPLDEPSTENLSAAVQRRQDLRDLLRDVRALPDGQRAALVLATMGGVSHDEIAEALDVPRERVKALVFQARSSLLASRDARDTPCAEIRFELSEAHGGSLRRSHLRRHLDECAGCRAYRSRLREQRRMLALALPVIPTLALKGSALTTALGGGGAGGAAAGGIAAAAAGGGGGAAATGGMAAGGSALAAKALVVATLAGGGAVGVQAVRDDDGRDQRAQVAESRAGADVTPAAGTISAGSGSAPAADALVTRPGPAPTPASGVTLLSGWDTGPGAAGPLLPGLPATDPSVPSTGAPGPAGQPEFAGIIEDDGESAPQDEEPDRAGTPRVERQTLRAERRQARLLEREARQEARRVEREARQEARSEERAERRAERIAEREERRARTPRPDPVPTPEPAVPVLPAPEVEVDPDPTVEPLPTVTPVPTPLPIETPDATVDLLP